MTSPPPASKLPFLDRHLRPWLESFGCIGGRHEMKRSHAQRSNFKVIESERISTFRKDCTGSRGARFRPVRGYGCGCQRHLIGSLRPRARDRGRVLFDGAYLGVGMLLRSRSHARRSPAGAFPASSDVGSPAMDMVYSEWESYPAIPAWGSFGHIYGWTGFAERFYLRLHSVGVIYFASKLRWLPIQWE